MTFRQQNSLIASILAGSPRFWTERRYRLKKPPVFFRQHHVLLSYKRQDEFVRKIFYTNQYNAAFTTAHARLRRYSMLQMLRDRVCYCVTDSVIQVSDDKTQQAIKSLTRDQLGQWDIDKALKDQNIKCKVNYIMRLVCVAPKDYGFILSNIENVGKTKRLRLNVEFKALSTFGSIVKLVQSKKKISFPLAIRKCLACSGRAQSTEIKSL